MTPLRSPSILGPYVRALALTRGDRAEAAAFLSGQPGAEAQQAGRLIKASIGAMAPADMAAATRAVGVELAALVRGESVIARVPGQRPAPFRSRIIEATAGARAEFVAPGEAVPVHVLAFDAAQPLLPTKTATIVLQTDELFRTSPQLADAIVPADLAAACAAGADAIFLDHTLAPADYSPGGIAYGCATLSSSGATATAITTDLRSMLQQVTSAGYSLATACWLAHSRTAGYLATLRSGDVFAFPGVRADGGSLLGLPLLASPNAPIAGSPGSTILTLLVGNQLRVADDGSAAVDVSKITSLQMNDAPTQNAVTPTATTMVSLFQSGGLAIKAERWMNWRLAQSSAAVVLEDVAF